MDNLQLDPQLQADLDVVLNRGVKSACVREDGHLIFVMSDNREVDLGDIQGPCMEALKTAERNIEGLWQDVSNLVETTVPKSGGAMTGDLDMGGNTVTGLGDPADDTDAVPMGYLERWLEVSGTVGHTPVKGVDYFTADDKNELVQAVLAALPVAEEGSF